MGSSGSSGRAGSCPGSSAARVKPRAGRAPRPGGGTPRRSRRRTGRRRRSTAAGPPVSTVDGADPGCRRRPDGRGTPPVPALSDGSARRPPADHPEHPGQPDRADRVAAQREEVVVQADRPSTQHGSPGRRDPPFGVGLGLHCGRSC